jgi:eukaryotic-like serine/threonine-protein kinase
VARNPTRIGRYDLISALAAGGMGRIYLARATGPGGFERKVVVKTLEIPVATETDPAVTMFLDEARLLGLLHHQHIASVFEVGCDDEGRHYMVLDYLEGASAHDVWERAAELGAALPLDFTLTVVSAAANGLHYTHTRKDAGGALLGIVHRDVTPSNVMIGHDGAVKLIDFGIAMATDRQTKTQTGFVKGKIGYLSPEQVAGGDVDARSDVFSLGILLYELSTLHRAFRDSSDLATMQRIKSGKVIRPSLVVADYLPELEAIVMKALHVDPRERFASADAMRRAIEALGHRLHLVLGDAAVIEVMAQLFDPGAGAAILRPPSRVSDPEIEWAESDRDRTVRRDSKELLAAMRAECATPAFGEAITHRPSTPTIADVRPRKLRAATEAADALIIQAADATASSSWLAMPPATSEVTAASTSWTASLTPSPAATTEPAAAAAADPPAAEPPAAAAALATPRIGASLVLAQAQRSSRLRWIGAAMLLLGVLGAVGYLVMRDSPNAAAGAATSPVTAPVVAHPAPVAVVTPPPPLPAPPGPPAPLPAPTQVHLRIVTHPADATVLLDGKKLGHTPFDELIDADPGKHVVKLRKRGYTTHRLDVELDADITQDIALTSQK